MAAAAQAPTVVAAAAAPPLPAAPASPAAPAGPCSAYKINMAASTFGECTCGFAKAAHSAAALRGGAPTGRRRLPQETEGGGAHRGGGKVAALAGKMAAGMRFAPMTLLPNSPPAISAADDGDAGPAARAARMRKASLRAAGLGSELSSMVMVHGGSQKELPLTPVASVRSASPSRRTTADDGEAAPAPATPAESSTPAAPADGGGEALTGLSLAVVSRARRTARPPTRKRG